MKLPSWRKLLWKLENRTADLSLSSSIPDLHIVQYLLGFDYKTCSTSSSDQCLVPSWQHYIERFWKLYLAKPGWRKYVTEGIFWRLYLVPWDFLSFCFPFIMMRTTFATCSCGHNGLSRSRPRNIEPIEHGLNPLKLSTPTHLSCLCQISYRLIEKSN